MDPMSPLALDDPRIEHRYVALSGVRLHCVVARPSKPRPGAPPVVLLHGFPEFWYAWRHQIVALQAAGFEVWAPDLRGYNLSDHPRGVANYTVERLADDVAELVAQIGPGPAHVVGHDWGGMVAWWFAMRHPAQLDRLVVLNCPHPGHQLAMMVDPEQLRRSFYMIMMQLPGLAERRLAADDFAVIRSTYRREPSSGPLADAEIDAHVAAIRNGSPTAMVNYYRALLRRSPFALRRALRPIDRPVQVLWGMADRHLGFRYAEPPAKWVWHCRFDPIPGASHWLHLDHADAVNTAMLEFFGVHDPSLGPSGARP